MIKNIFRERSVDETAQICKYGIFSAFVATVGLLCAAAVMDAPQHVSAQEHTDTQHVEQTVESFHTAKMQNIKPTG